MVQLSNRLQMVADMVTKGNRVGDIGCDHAHISIYLVEHGISDKIIAADINWGPLERAKKNIILHGCQDKIELRLSDGVKELKQGEVDTLLISGMGGGLMIKILTESPHVMEETKELILQPQSEIGGVRRFLHDNGFCITSENMLTEDGKPYTAIRGVKGEEQYEREIYYQYGKLLLEEKNRSLYEFLHYGKENFEKIIIELEKQDYDRNKERLFQCREKLSLMKEALLYYRERE